MRSLRPDLSLVGPDGDLARPITRADVLRAMDVAQLLNMPKSTVEDWARRGILPSRKRGKRRFFLRWEIEAWLMADDSSAVIHRPAD